MRLVANFKDVGLVHVAKSAVCRLQVIERIAHVTFGREDDGLESIVGVANLFEIANLFESDEDLFVGEATVSEYGGSGLDGFDDFGGYVAG